MVAVLEVEAAAVEVVAMVVEVVVGGGYLCQRHRQGREEQKAH